MDPSEVITLDGVWLSKVYSGSYINLPDWVEDVKAYVKKYHGRIVNPRKELLAFDPTVLDDQTKAPDETVVVFFVKIID